MKNIEQGLIKAINYLDYKITTNKASYFLTYTIVFIATFSMVFFYFIREGRSFVWLPDGQEQHFNALAYHGFYLRSIVRSLLRGNLEVPLWDFTLGFGADILTTLHYYGIGDPLTLLSVFVPTRHTEHLYNFLVILRFYLIGIAFSVYSFKMKRNSYSTLIGALIYVFCGFAIIAVRHPFFLNPLIYLPLLCLGIEKIFLKEKPHFFTLMVFISLASSFYFFYMLTILIFIYALIRFFFVYPKFSWRVFTKDLVRFIFYYLIGVLMAGAIAFPNIYALLITSRNEMGIDIPLFFSFEYYQNFLAFFISSQHAGYWTALGYASISFLSVLYLVLFKNKYLQLRIGFVVLTVMLMFPYISHVMHGFSYVTNRWIWGYSFLVAFIVTSILPELIKISRKRLAVLSVFAVAYSIIIISTNAIRNASTLAGVITLLLSVITLLVIRSYQVKNNAHVYLVLLVMVVFNIVVLGYFRNSPHELNYVADFQESGASLALLQQSGLRSISPSVEDDFFRVEENPFASGFTRNAPVQARVNGSSFYWSLANPHVFQFLDEMHHWAVRDYRYVGLDGRTMLGALVSNRYFVVREGHEAFLPYGYEQEPVSRAVAFSGRHYGAFLNEHALSLGYTYRYYLTRSQYDLLSPFQRQQALLQAVLLEDRELKNEIPLMFSEQILPHEIEVGAGIVLEDQMIIVSEREAMLIFTFEGVSNSETYINFNQIYFEGNRDRVRIDARTDDLRKDFRIATPSCNWYAGRHNFALNMGYRREPLNQITVIFSDRGRYRFESIEIVAQPMDYFAEMVTNLREYSLENVVLSTNQIEGTIQLSEDRILVLSIPYSGGWRAYINGEIAEIQRANTMFMAIEVSEGDHQITLTYRTPFLSSSIALTVVGWSLFGGTIVYFKLDSSKKLST